MFKRVKRWEHVFRHEHIAVVWRRDIDPHSEKYRRQSLEGQAKAVEGENITFQNGVERVITASVVSKTAVNRP